MAGLLSAIFGEDCNGLTPADLYGTAETLERELTAALVILDDCQDRGGFETVRPEGQP